MDPNLESIVYFAWGKSLAGGQRPVLALCPTTPEQMDSGTSSPCVASALKLFRTANITPVPATYVQWLESFLPASDLKEKADFDLLLARREPKLS
jgi:hypothetical protein